MIPPQADQTSGSAPEAAPGIQSIRNADAAASPCEMPHCRDKDVPFWTPGWGDGFRQLGWRWILILPAPLMIAAIVGTFYWPVIGFRIWWFGFKPVVFLLMLPVTALKRVMHASVQKRTEPFCIHCGYGLSGLPDRYTCPECGRPYTFALIDEYRRNPEFFVKRWKSQHVPTADVPFLAGTGKRRKRSRDGT